jgi:hypothetical protein
VKKLVSVAIPCALIRVYWLLVPMWIRRFLSSPPGTSVPAYHAIKAGGGWKAFWWHALPRKPSNVGVAPDFWGGAWIVGPDGVSNGVHTWNFETSVHGGWIDWAHYK